MVSITLKDICAYYEDIMQNMESEAHRSTDHSYGGYLRQAKGSLVERIAKDLVLTAWQQLGGNPGRLSFERMAVPVSLKPTYLAKLTNPTVIQHIRDHQAEYTYDLRTDVHVWIDGRFVIGIECKAYAENAMLKRILVDFTILRTAHPNLKCVLLQLESQLTGDYGQLANPVTLGSRPTHTLLSLFDVDLSIITLLEGERRVDRPIHEKKYYKPLEEVNLQRAVETLKGLLAPSL